MSGTLEKIHFLNTKFIDIIYPIGSVICLASDTDPATLFDSNTTGSKIPDNNSLHTADQPGIAYGHTSVSFTPQGSFSAVALTSNQSPILQCGAATSTTASGIYRTDTDTTYSLYSGQSTYAYADSDTGGSHGHNAHSAAYATSYTGYFDNVYSTTTPTAGAGTNNLKTYASGSTYYTCTVPTSSPGFSTVNQTLALSVTHNHTMTVGANSAATTTHSHTITHSAVTFDLTAHPKLNMTIGKRIA